MVDEGHLSVGRLVCTRIIITPSHSFSKRVDCTYLSSTLLDKLKAFLPPPMRSRFLPFLSSRRSKRCEHTSSAAYTHKSLFIMGKEKTHISLVIIGHVDAGKFRRASFDLFWRPKSEKPMSRDSVGEQWVVK